MTPPPTRARKLGRRIQLVWDALHGRQTCHRLGKAVPWETYARIPLDPTTAREPTGRTGWLQHTIRRGVRMGTADLYEGHLAKLGVTSFGRAWNLTDPTERRQAAEWLADLHAAATKEGGSKPPPPAWQD